MHMMIVKAIADGSGPDITGRIVPMPAGSYHLCREDDRSWFEQRSDVFSFVTQRDDSLAPTAFQLDANGNVTGLVGPDGSVLLRSRTPRLVQTGRNVCDWSNFASPHVGPSVSSALVSPAQTPPAPYSWTKVAELTGVGVGDADGSICQVAISGGSQPTLEGLKTLGVWVLNATNAVKPFRVHIYDATAARYAYANFAAPPAPGWQFLAVPSANFLVNTILTSDKIGFVRVTERAAPNSWSSWGVGEKVQFGGVEINARGRATFVLQTDDGYATNLHSATGDGYVIDRSYLAIASRYGYGSKLTAYIVPTLIGTAGYLSWNDLGILRDLGWTIASHSYSHPADGSNNGLRLLGPAFGGSVDAIYSDVMRGVDVLVEAGFPTAARHFALPQGGWDQYVREAVLRCGFSTIRGVSTHTGGGTIPGLVNTGGGRAGSSFIPAGFPNLLGSVQVDDAADAATRNPQLAAYVDQCIDLGGIGTCYTHGLSATTATKFDYLCSYLRSKERDGLIDVISLDELSLASHQR